MQVDQDSLRRKNEEIIQALREKTRKHLQTQELYDKLKCKGQMGQIQEAAMDAADHTIQASFMANHYTNRVGNDTQRVPPPPLFTAPPSNRRPNIPQNITNITSQTSRVGAPTHGWAGFSSQGSSQREKSLLWQKAMLTIHRKSANSNSFYASSTNCDRQCINAANWSSTSTEPCSGYTDAFTEDLPETTSWWTERQCWRFFWVCWIWNECWSQSQQSNGGAEACDAIKRSEARTFNLHHANIAI